VGRDGLLRLGFERRGGRTVLTERRFRLPLQALEPVDLDGSGAAVLMLLNPTGGLLGGDVLDTDVRLGPGSHACLTTPAATRVYRSDGAPAVQRVRTAAGAGAVLEWVPDHVIPSPGARLRQSTDVSLAADATLLLVDAWATGRLARGEGWGFRSLDSALVVRDDRGPVLAERSVLDHAGWSGLGGTEGFGYVATLLAARAGLADWAGLAGALRADLETAAPTARAGVALLSRGGVLARLLCPSAPVLQACVQAFWARSRRALLALPPLDLRKP
jgi:urease accessory protein